MRTGKTLLRLGLAVSVAVGAIPLLESTAWAVGEEKAGPFMGNLKIGPAIRLDDIPTQFAMEVEIAGALDRGNDAYLGFNPQFQFSDGLATINLTATFQYDIELPVKALYLYPKINAGLAINAPTGRGGDPALGFALQPEFGIKYQLVEHAHIGAEPISIPLYLGNNRYIGAIDAQYRLFFYGGFDI
ncbi:MAG: hypothetical protein JNL21_13195 [Myxococcales bacterium]|nr:hypothetical protein [Myxococcales bacterium]